MSAEMQFLVAVGGGRGEFVCVCVWGGGGGGGGCVIKNTSLSPSII